MPTKSKRVIHVQKSLAKPYKILIRVGILITIILATIASLPHPINTSAAGCPDLKVIFARGSGGDRYTSGHYLAFKSALEQKLQTSSLTYEFEDLDYPAISIGISDGHLSTLVNAFIGSGDAYDFGDSVHQGTDELLRVVNHDPCKNTKYVFAGYSQGALVLLNGLNKINPGRIVYVATFGDPKIYLPEGAGFVPRACSGKNLSDYRIYVPDCRAHKGMLGARDPYVIPSFQGKVGTWCNKGDVLCSSHLNIRDHTHYAEDGVYEDASRYIFSRIARTYGFKNQYTSPHDTAILINSTISMTERIPNYQARAYHVAEKTLRAGGRVAIYNYYDTGNGTVFPTERCSFDTCNLENLKIILDSIPIEPNTQTSNPLLSNSLHVMKQLNWRIGSTKSLVVFTDSSYQSPDLGNTSFYDVRKLSQQIDPVNFYIVTDEANLSAYQSLAEATDGAVVSATSDEEELTSLIMDRFDSLPQVEEEYEDETYDTNIPTLEINETTKLSPTSTRVSYTTTGTRAIVILNDAILGVTDQGTITLTDLREDVENILTLVPISDSRRGDPVSVTLSSPAPASQTSNILSTNTSNTPNSVSEWRLVIPKAPNTGVK